MKSRGNFLSILVLILAGSIAVPTDYVFAKKSVKTKKKTDKKKKKKETKSNTSSAEEIVSSDISTERRGGTTSTSSSARTGSSETTVDPATETATLTENLKSCLASSCSGTVPYEKCFKSSNIDTALLTNPSCSSYLQSASSEAIKVDAKNATKNYIKTKFTEACESVEGTVSGEKCKIKVWYYAKAPSGASISRSKDVIVGNTFTCTYSDFGLSQQDLEYKGEKTAEQKVAELQATMQMVTGLINVGTQAVQAISSAKNLKRANAYEEDAWYKFNGKTLERDGNPICTYDYGTDGSGMKKKDWDVEKQSKGDSVCSTDTNGARYCTKTTDYAQCPGKGVVPPHYPECDKSKVEEQSKGGSVTCYVYIEKSNEYKRAEKLKELVSWMNLEELKSKALKEQRRNAIMQTYAAPELANSISAGASTVNDMSCPERKTVQKSDSVTTVAQAKTAASNLKSPECREYNNEFRCANSEYKSENNCADSDDKNCKKWKIIGCEWNNNNWVMKFDSPIDKVNYINSRADSYAHDVDSVLAAMDGLSINDSTNAYNNTVTAYNDANNKLNTKKKELEALEEQKSAALTNTISAGTQTVLTGFTTSLTNKYTADGNKELMSGACYKSKTDPKTSLGSASLLAKEGATIKLKYE